MAVGKVKCSVLGDLQNNGVLTLEALELNAPGMIIMCTVDSGGTRLYSALWFDMNGDLRTADVTGVYDPSDQMLDLTSFDQASAGVIVGTQS